MTFDFDKKTCLSKLYKPDNSKKGCVDEEIKYLIDKINSLAQYYTTSSCAGRIVMIVIPKTGRKDHAKWLFTSHEKVNPDDLPMKKFPKEEVWFRQESVILHVCCKTIEAAQKLVDKAKLAGFKRSGIMATKKRIMAELIGTESMDTIISKNGKLLADRDYIKVLAEEANKKLKKTREKAKRLYNNL